MRRNRDVSVTEEIEFTEPDAPLTEEQANIEGFVWAEFVDANKRDFADSLDWKIGKRLGCGVYGCVYESSGPWVVKITRDPTEGPAWRFIEELYADPEVGSLMGGFCRVSDVARLRPDVVIAPEHAGSRRMVVIEATPEDHPSTAAPVYAIQREAADPVFDEDDRYAGIVFVSKRTADELFLAPDDLRRLPIESDSDLGAIARRVEPPEVVEAVLEDAGGMLPMSMVWDLMSTDLDPAVRLRIHDLALVKVAVQDFWTSAGTYYDVSRAIERERDPQDVTEMRNQLNALAIKIRTITKAMAERPNASENMFGYTLGTTLWTAFNDGDFLPSDLHMFNIGWRDTALIGDSTLPLTLVVTDPGKAMTPWRPEIRDVDLKQILRRNGLDIDAHMNGVRATDFESRWCTLCGQEIDRTTSCRRCEEDMWEWAMAHTQKHMRANAAMVPARVRSRELYKYDPLLIERDLGTGAVIPESFVEMIEKRRLTDPGLPADPEERAEMREKGYRFDPATGEPLNPNAKKKKRRGPIYTAIVLDEPSKDSLLGWWEDNVGPLHQNIYAHHMTIQFGPSEEDVAATPLGDSGSLRVVGIAQDERGQAVVVEPSYPSTKALPHVTVAVAEGVKPVYSNELLARGYEEVDGPLLTGTILGQ